MAQGDLNMHQDMDEEQRLKYLEFVQVATIHAVLCFSNLYGYAKDKTGPLKPSIDTIEATVKNVVAPVYHKFHDVPVELLKFVDRKVDESLTELDRHMPVVVKQVSSQAITAAQNAPVVARSVASDVQLVGVVEKASGVAKYVYAKCEPTTKELYTKYEPVAERCVVSTWRKLNKVPLFPQMAQVVVPTASYCSEKYNQTVQTSAEKGYKVSSYLPLVPTEKIAKMFREDEPEMQPMVSSGAVH